MARTTKSSEHRAFGFLKAELKAHMQRELVTLKARQRRELAELKAVWEEKFERLDGAMVAGEDANEVAFELLGITPKLTNAPRHDPPATPANPAPHSSTERAPTEAGQFTERAPGKGQVRIAQPDARGYHPIAVTSINDPQPDPRDLVGYLPATENYPHRTPVYK